MPATSSLDCTLKKWKSVASLSKMLKKYGSLWKSLCPWRTKNTAHVFVSLQQAIEAKHLPLGTLAQKEEHIALTWALILGKDKKLNIYTASKNVFLVIYAHAAVRKGWNLQYTIIYNVRANYCINHKGSLSCQTFAVIHCKGNQRNMFKISLRNQTTDRKKREPYSHSKPYPYSQFLTIYEN